MNTSQNNKTDFDQKAFADRLSKLLGRQSFRSFAQRAGMSDSGLKKYLFDGTIPPIHRAIQLAEAAGVSFDYLVFGIGEQDNGVVTPIRRDAVMPSNDDQFTTITAYEIAASAGHGAHVDDEPLAEPMAFRTDWLRREGLDPAKLAVIRAKGDSMEPTISDGDVILVRLANGEGPRDGLHVLRLDGGLFVKRLQFDLGGVRVISDNPLYKSRDLSKEEAANLDLVGRVVWAGKKF